jgi:hypothetical protein
MVLTEEDVTDELAATLCLRVRKLARPQLDVLEAWLDAGASPTTPPPASPRSRREAA